MVSTLRTQPVGVEGVSALSFPRQHAPSTETTTSNVAAARRKIVIVRKTHRSIPNLPERLGHSYRNLTCDGIDFRQFVTKMVTVTRGEGDLQGNSRFAVGVHAMALAFIAQEMRKGKPVTSSAIAAMVGAHPVHVRRVMGTLREAGLVESQPGPTGGWALARDPREISLYDIYHA